MVPAVFVRFFLLLLPLMIAACQGPMTRADKPDALTKDADRVVNLPYTSTLSRPKELDKEIVFHYLAGQISAQRGAFEEAYEHYLQAAVRANDDVAAGKATRIALHLNDTAAALKAVRRWIELAPNAMSARQIAALLFLRDGDPESAMSQIEALLRVAEAKDINGFTQAAAIITKESEGQDALQLMQRLTEKYNDDARAFYALAMVEIAAKRLSDAEEHLYKAIELDARWEKPYVLLGQVLISEKRPNDALALLAKSVDKFPQARSLRMSYARTLVDQEQFEPALKQFRILREQDPEDIDVLYLLGILAVQTESWDEARGVWQKLRADRQRFDEASYFLGQVEEFMGNIELAKGLYRSVKKGRLRTDARIHLARLEASQGNMTTAQDILKKLRVLDNTRAAEIFIAEANLLQEKSLADEAFKLYDTAITAFPENLELRYNRGLFAANSSRLEMMEADFRFVIEKDPEHANALNALGYTLADKTDRYDEAFTYVMRANKLKPNSPAILDSLGWIYYRLGDYSTSLEYLRRAASMIEDAEISAHLGEVLWVTGEQKAARDVWEAALEAEPESPILRGVMEQYR